jgi:hypothetical protein
MTTKRLNAKWVPQKGELDIVIGSNRRIGFNITIDRNISNKKWSFTKQNLLIKNHQFEKLIWNNPNIKREDNTRVGENYDR